MTPCASFFFLSPGSRCEGSSDCKQGLCCARAHGERVCKAKLSLGHNCYVPQGGLQYVLNELCPCEEGLVCKNVGTKMRRE